MKQQTLSPALFDLRRVGHYSPLISGQRDIQSLFYALIRLYGEGEPSGYK